MAEFSLDPVDVPRIETSHRTIKTKLPVQESLEAFRELIESEPPSMLGQPPVVWHRAEGFQVADEWGNSKSPWSQFVDFSDDHPMRSAARITSGSQAIDAACNGSPAAFSPWSR